MEVISTKMQVVAAIILVGIVLLYGCTRPVSKVTENPLRGVETNQGYDY